MNENDIKRVHTIYGIIIGVLMTVIIIGGGYFSSVYENDVADERKGYLTAKAEYDEALERILKEEEEWKIELEELHNEASSMSAELTAIYKERQEEKDAEEERWNSLSEEEKQAEKKCKAYNEMVSYLRANNPAYAKLYVKYAAYLSQDIFNLDKETLLEYTQLYSKKIEIEKEYMEEHPF